jgi:hypothetical protein
MERSYIYFWETAVENGRQEKGSGVLTNCELCGVELFERLVECAKESNPRAFLFGVTEIPNKQE